MGVATKLRPMVLVAGSSDDDGSDTDLAIKSRRNRYPGSTRRVILSSDEEADKLASELSCYESSLESDQEDPEFEGTTALATSLQCLNLSHSPCILAAPVHSAVFTPLRTPVGYKPFTPRPTVAPVPTPQTTAKTSAMTPSKRGFVQVREQLAAHWYQQFNETIFQSKLPLFMEIIWSSKLNTTAGQTVCMRTQGRHTACIQLSTKVLDTTERLRKTLCHEMCHAAAWIIDHTAKPPHGPVFKAHAARAMQVFPELDITTCHSYAIDYKHRWQCQSCRHVFGRHSKSIDPAKHACGRCSGRLTALFQLKADGTPARPRAPNAFATFVKTNYRTVQTTAPGQSHGDIMKLLSQRFKAQSLAQS